MKVRREGQACVRCLPQPPPYGAWDLPNLWRSSPTAGSRGELAAPALGTCHPRRQTVGRSLLFKMGDEILIDIPKRKIDLVIGESELQTRMKRWRPKEREIEGYLRWYRRACMSADRGALVA